MQAIDKLACMASRQLGQLGMRWGLNARALHRKACSFFFLSLSFFFFFPLRSRQPLYCN